MTTIRHREDLDLGAMDRAAKIFRFALAVRRFSSPAGGDPPEYPSVQWVAQRFRSICADEGPFEAAAAVHLPGDMAPDVEPGLRFTAYLLAHATACDDALELCVEQGVLGFDDWLRANR